MERLEIVTNHFAFSLDHGNHLWPGILEWDEIDIPSSHFRRASHGRSVRSGQSHEGKVDV
jgi:hypothetical protein